MDHTDLIGRAQTKPTPTDPDLMTNPYKAQILEQGKEPSNASAPKKTFPCTIGARTYQTEEEYQEALYDFLNGY